MSTSSPIAAARRGTELGLVVMAGVVTAIAYTLASLGKNAEIPPIIVPFLIALLGLLLLAHLATRLLASGAEPRLNLCAPGGKETARMLKVLAVEITASPAAVAPTVAAPAEPGAKTASAVRGWNGWSVRSAIRPCRCRRWSMRTAGRRLARFGWRRVRAAWKA
jgi:steroid 5-alpha reductase family enzyme